MYLLLLKIHAKSRTYTIVRWQHRWDLGKCCSFTEASGSGNAAEFFSGIMHTVSHLMQLIT